jgi:hypothetical protein
MIRNYILKETKLTLIDIASAKLNVLYLARYYIQDVTQKNTQSPQRIQQKTVIPCTFSF